MQNPVIEEHEEPADNTSETNTELTCPECKGTLVSRSTEKFCEDCGLVVQKDEIDHGPEWRAYTHADHENKKRVGAPRDKMLHDGGLSTRISWQNRDAYGRTLSANQRRRMKRLRTWDERARTRDSKERNLKHALGEIKRMSSALGIPENVRETASVIYRRCLNEDLIRGRCIESVATASLYAASRDAQLPRSLDEFITVSRVEEQRIARSYRYISRELGLALEPPTATDYIPKVATGYEITDETKQLATDLLRTAIDNGIHSGKHPNGLAAAALYAAGLLNDDQDPDITQADMADAGDVCEVTIRNRHREILEVNGEHPRIASLGHVKDDGAPEPDSEYAETTQTTLAD